MDISYWEVRYTQTYADRERNYTRNFMSDNSLPEIEQLRNIMTKVVELAEDVRNVHGFRFQRKYLVIAE